MFMREAEAYWRSSQVTHLTDTQWGDTGKGKLGDEAAEHVDVVVRSNGGANAGHTVRNQYGEFRLHLVPAGFANPGALCVIGQGTVVDPFELIKEYEEINARVPQSARLLISDKAPLVMPWHIHQDRFRETARGDQPIGTTIRGIGPAYADHTNRVGIRMGDLLRPNLKEIFYKEATWQERQVRLMSGERFASEMHPGKSLDENLEKNTPPQNFELINMDTLLEELLEVKEFLGPMIGNAYEVIYEAKEKGKQILSEAGQGQLLDLDQGGYPYVTSSHPGIIGAMISTGLTPREIGRVIGSTKAYTTRVGEGPMPTELMDETGNYLREIGGEYGATTGRPRRCGWFDAVATRHGAETAGVTDVALMKFDVLDKLPQVKVCVAYEVNGKRYDRLPDADPDFMAKAEPIYEILPGWKKDTSRITKFNKLPLNAKEYIWYLQALLNKRVSLISVGPDRGETIYRVS